LSRRTLIIVIIGGSTKVRVANRRVVMRLAHNTASAFLVAVADVQKSHY
jgi:hypothetical protein